MSEIEKNKGGAFLGIEGKKVGEEAKNTGGVLLGIAAGGTASKLVETYMPLSVPPYVGTLALSAASIIGGQFVKNQFFKKVILGIGATTGMQGARGVLEEHAGTNPTVQSVLGYLPDATPALNIMSPAAVEQPVNGLGSAYSGLPALNLQESEDGSYAYKGNAGTEVDQLQRILNG